MTTIQSVLGEVDANALGHVLVHEHVVAASPGILTSWPDLYGSRQALIDRGVRALRDARDAGVGAVVDCTTFDLGRDAGLLAAVSEAAEVTIIGSTGIWLDPGVTLRARTVDALARGFLRDLTHGMDGTSIRAGVIKVASDERVEPFAAMVLEAAARANAETGAPIITHTAALHHTGLAQAEILESHGVDPARVAIGHSDDSDDLEYLAGLAERGYYIGMDRLPNGALPQYGGQTVDDRMDMIVALVGRGHADKVLLAHDDPIWAGLLTDEDQAAHLESNPDVIAFVSRVILPGLLQRGVTREDVGLMTVENPRRWLTGE
jgi:phosphotriesterase-related protein